MDGWEVISDNVPARFFIPQSNDLFQVKHHGQSICLE